MMEVTPTAGHDPHRRPEPGQRPGAHQRPEPGQRPDPPWTVGGLAGGDVLDALPDAVLVVDAHGTLRMVNDMAARLYGVSAAKLIGRPAGEMLALTDEAGNDWWACVAPLAGDPHVGQRLVERDLTLRTPAGRERPVTVTGRRIARREDRPQAAASVGAVVLSLRPAEQRRRLDAARSDLVSTVSHELRSPLTTVKGFTKTLLAKWERFSDEQKRHMLATIDEDADRVTRLLGELLDVSRIDAGRLRLSRRMIDLSSVVQRVLDAFAVRHPDRAYVNDVPAAVPRVYADPDKMAQVITNLVENATNYGSGRVVVAADVPTEDASHLRCTVSDQGGGIRPEHLRQIFTKFHRRQGERHTGTGLGLYITRGIIEAHGGQIWAETDPGTATRFRFSLPLGGLELAGITEETRRLATERR